MRTKRNARYLAAEHVLVSRPGVPEEPIDEALTVLGANRKVAAVVGGFATAIALTRTSELVASVPERHTAGARDGMFSFALPYPVKDFVISAMWHPRLDADLAHQWLRECVQRVCQAANPSR